MSIAEIAAARQMSTNGNAPLPLELVTQVKPLTCGTETVEATLFLARVANAAGQTKVATAFIQHAVTHAAGFHHRPETVEELGARSDNLSVQELTTIRSTIL